jgi:hypothetical protein
LFLHGWAKITAGNFTGFYLSMKIILAEERSGGGMSPERTFDQGVIRIGRDPVDSDIAFDGKAYPMV